MDFITDLRLFVLVNILSFIETKKINLKEVVSEVNAPSALG